MLKRADVPLFETIKTNAGTQPKNELQQYALVWQYENLQLIFFAISR